MKILLSFFFGFAAFTYAFAQHQLHSNENHEISLSKLLNDENLLRQFQQWQQSISSEIQQNQQQQQPVENTVLAKDGYGSDGGYGGNPWLQPNPGPVAPPTQPPPYGNPWYQSPPQVYPPVTMPPPPVYPPVTAPPSVYPPAATSPPLTPEVAALRKFCLKPRGQYPAKACNKYVNCWDDTIIEQECPSGLLFSEKGYCDYPYNVDCGGRSSSVEGVTNPPTITGGQKHCPTPFGNYRSSTNCSEFFVCVHGSPVKFSCPSYLYYSTELGVCDYPYNVNCINPRPLLKPQPPPTPSTELPPPSPIYNPYYLQRISADLLEDNRGCIPNSVYRLESDCSSVALCKDGKTQVVTCGQHTAYNADNGLCVDKHLAKC